MGNFLGPRLKFPHKTDLYDAELRKVLTITECCALFNKSRTGVINAINVGRVYAIKKDADEGSIGGTWLISFTSANDLWGENPASESENDYVSQ